MGQLIRLADYRRPPGAPATVKGLPVPRKRVCVDSESRVVTVTRKRVA